MPQHRNTVAAPVMLRLLIAVSALTLVLWACTADTLEPLTLDITATADRSTAAPADSINFEFRAQGGRLLTLSVEWGDGTTYSAPLNGARTAVARRRHAYQQSGVYQVSAELDDAAAGTKTATLSVTIQ
jgi:hypothetical protein